MNLEKRSHRPFKEVKAVWILVAVCSAIYAFVGIAVCGVAITTRNLLLIGLSLLAYALNLALLSYAKKRFWENTNSSREA